jgi:hypothetical protein
MRRMRRLPSLQHAADGYQHRLISDPEFAIGGAMIPFVALRESARGQRPALTWSPHFGVRAYLPCRRTLDTDYPAVRSRVHWMCWAATVLARSGGRIHEQCRGIVIDPDDLAVRLWAIPHSTDSECGGQGFESP